MFWEFKFILLNTSIIKQGVVMIEDLGSSAEINSDFGSEFSIQFITSVLLKILYFITILYGVCSVSAGMSRCQDGHWT